MSATPLIPPKGNRWMFWKKGGAVKSTVPICTRRSSGTLSATSVAPAAHSPPIPSAVTIRNAASHQTSGASAHAPVPSE